MAKMLSGLMTFSWACIVVIAAKTSSVVVKIAFLFMLSSLFIRFLFITVSKSKVQAKGSRWLESSMAKLHIFFHFPCSYRQKSSEM